MKRKEIDNIFQEYGAYATGKDYALVHAVAKAVASQRTWVGLTPEEVVDLKLVGRDLEFVSMTALRRFARDIEAKLKEKNSSDY